MLQSVSGKKEAWTSSPYGEQAWGNKKLKAQSDECGFDLILLDPPRQGAAEQTAQLVELADLLYENAPDSVPDIVPDIVMVSCNPHTAVRDIAVLVAAGWQLEEVQMIDQFVRTAHTEIVTRLVFDDRQNTRR